MSAAAQQVEGGAGWERGQAAKLLAEGVRAGDAETVELAANRLGDALVNGVAAAMIPTLQNVLELVLRRQIDQIAERLDNRDRHDLDWRTELRSHLDARFDAYGQELDQKFDLLGLMNIRVGDLEQRVADNELRQARYESEQAQLRSEMVLIRRVLETLQQGAAMAGPRD